MQQILERQQAMGEDVGYVISRTVRSCIQYNAAAELGAAGSGNQCQRAACMAAAMAMFCGKGGEGIPKAVVWALLKY